MKPKKSIREIIEEIRGYCKDGKKDVGETIEDTSDEMLTDASGCFDEIETCCNDLEASLDEVKESL